MKKTKSVFDMTETERRETILARSIEVNEPYKVFRVPQEGRRRTWSIIYQDPRSTKRELVMEDIADQETANDLRELLERAWALGRLSGAE